jgi:hypothetical protein
MDIELVSDEASMDSGAVNDKSLQFIGREVVSGSLFAAAVATQTRRDGCFECAESRQLDDCEADGLR